MAERDDLIPSSVGDGAGHVDITAGERHSDSRARPVGLNAGPVDTPATGLTWNGRRISASLSMPRPTDRRRHRGSSAAHTARRRRWRSPEPFSDSHFLDGLPPIETGVERGWGESIRWRSSAGVVPRLQHIGYGRNHTDRLLGKRPAPRDSAEASIHIARVSSSRQ